MPNIFAPSDWKMWILWYFRNHSISQCERALRFLRLNMLECCTSDETSECWRLAPGRNVFNASCATSNPAHKLALVSCSLLPADDGRKCAALSNGLLLPPKWHAWFWWRWKLWNYWSSPNLSILNILVFYPALADISKTDILVFILPQLTSSDHWQGCQTSANRSCLDPPGMWVLLQMDS